MTDSETETSETSDAEASETETSDAETSDPAISDPGTSETPVNEPEPDAQIAQRSQPMTLNQRLLYALRQAALLGSALLIAGLVTERLRPDELLDRGLASTTFLWAIVGWLGVLLLNAITFERSQLHVVEGKPLIAALGIGAIVFVIGLASLEGSSFGRRAIYLFANSLGAVMFWWALLSLAALVTRRITRS